MTMKDLRILIVDDEHEIVELLEDLLTEKGYNVSTAFTLDEARQKIKQYDPGIVLLDIKLPDGDGVDFLQEIKKKNPKIDVIMITGLSDKEIALTALKRGAADYITKPIDLDYLTSSVLAKVITSYT